MQEVRPRPNPVVWGSDPPPPLTWYWHPAAHGTTGPAPDSAPRWPGRCGRGWPARPPSVRGWPCAGRASPREPPEAGGGGTGTGRDWALEQRVLPASANAVRRPGAGAMPGGACGRTPRGAGRERGCAALPNSRSAKTSGAHFYALHSRPLRGVGPRGLAAAAHNAYLRRLRPHATSRPSSRPSLPGAACVGALRAIWTLSGKVTLPPSGNASLKGVVPSSCTEVEFKPRRICVACVA